MVGTIWTKFYWQDWMADAGLRRCSLQARGLWMDLLCIAAQHDPIGYVAIAGEGLSTTDIARMTGASDLEVTTLLEDLSRNGVFSRDRNGKIYSRRMVFDAKKAKIAKKNGKSGGNPTLGNNRGNPASDNPPDKLPDKSHAIGTISQLLEKKEAGSAGEGASACVFDLLEKRLCDAARPMPIGINPDIAPMSQLIANGFSLELDIFPAIEAAKRDGKRFSKWSALVGWVETQNASRMKAEKTKPINGKGADCPPGETYQQKREQVWMQQLVAWKKHGHWSDQWGTAPGNPSCQIPREFIEKFERQKANGATA